MSQSGLAFTEVEGLVQSTEVKAGWELAFMGSKGQER